MPVNVATPPEMPVVAFVTDPAPVAIAAVRIPAAVVTTFPPESSTVTTGWVESSVPLVAPPGWVVMTSWVAAPVAMAIAAESSDEKPSPEKPSV